MKYIKLNSQSVKYREFSDYFLVRTGIWDYKEITFYKEEFEKNDSNYKTFINLLKKVFNNGKQEYSLFQKDKYFLTLLNSLEECGLIKIENSSLLKEMKTVVITCQKAIPILYRYSELINLKNIKFISLDKIEIAKLQFLVEDFDRVIVLIDNMYVEKMLGVNEVLYNLKKIWSLGIIDGNFVHMSTFDGDNTGCLECLESSNTIRMTEYENYIAYRQNERKYSLAQVINSNLIIYVYQQLLLYSLGSYSLLGTLLTIYWPKLEINVEPLHKDTLCALHGVKARSISEGLNLNAEKIIGNINLMHKKEDN